MMLIIIIDSSLFVIRDGPLINLDFRDCLFSEVASSFSSVFQIQNLFSPGTNLIFENNVFSNCLSLNKGGGVFNLKEIEGRILLKNNIFINNAAEKGGCLFLEAAVMNISSKNNIFSSKFTIPYN